MKGEIINERIIEKPQSSEKKINSKVQEEPIELDNPQQPHASTTLNQGHTQNHKWEDRCSQ